MVNYMKKMPYLLMLFLYLIIIYRIIDIKFINFDEYYKQYLIKSNNVIEGPTALRGRILDSNGVVLVDNQIIHNLEYRKIDNVSYNMEIEYAKTIQSEFNIDKSASINELKNFYLLSNDTSNLLTPEEKELYKYRKLSDDDIYKIKIDRIDNELDMYNDIDKYIIHTFYMMNNGYINETKTLLSDINEELCAKVSMLNIKGLSCSPSWKRVINYPYIASILGSVGQIREEDKDLYLNNGYEIKDLVGLSGLERQYDNVLKGEKAKYKVNKDNTLTLIKDSKIGSDIVLSLDIGLEQKIYDTLKENLDKAKKFRATSYYKESYAIVSIPSTGEIKAILGLRRDEINNEVKYVDITNNTMISSYIVGSVVKGASNSVGYLNNAIDIGKKIKDSCVKLYSVPSKCSFKRLGYIDDITALKMSSNYYQFITAIKTTGNKYKRNMKLDVDINDFNRYRDIFKKYGLGSLTGIDFPKEYSGIEGKTIAPDLFLNLSIGQYDTYTPMQLVAYINTIANKGVRKRLSFIKQDNEIIDNVNLSEEYYNRIHEGFYEVVNNGTGRGYTNKKYKAAGKTGTSEVYLNNKINTINQSYIMFAPYDNPKYSLVVVNPNISYNDGKNTYIAPINRLISKTISDYLLENY